MFSVSGELANCLYVPQVTTLYVPHLASQLRLLFRLLFDLKLHKSHKISNLMLKLLNCLLALVVWSYIKYYRSQRDYYHNLILAHQERTEMEFLKKNCLKI
ncbi:hypothetical protein MACK_003319 [Theileria orientalis]|uniref:Uncharacterized protein n=1 Tax=Theileria orientalis TaxID=68886 RepID=A0A976XHK2_THEOR|nr:hypothetical protein MACK_003319 [Theileria orientalis]